jgi:hypothetical protein
MSQIIITYKLKPGVAREQYETWTRTRDYPAMRGLKRVASFTNYRASSNMLTGEPSTLDYLEIFDVPDLAGFMAEDMSGAIVQGIMGEFMQFVENPEFIVAEEVV